MSSSDEHAEPAQAGRPGWDLFEERPAPAAEPADIPPDAELAGLLQRYQEDLRVARGAASASLTDSRRLSFELATLTGRLRQLLARAEAPMAASGQQRMHRQLCVVKDQMLQTLGDSGIDVRDPLGLTAAEVEDWADAVGWRHGPEFTEEIVAQTDEPAVFHDGAVVRFARVVMGSPPEPEPEPEPEPGPEVTEPKAADAADASGGQRKEQTGTKE